MTNMNEIITTGNSQSFFAVNLDSLTPIVDRLSGASAQLSNEEKIAATGIVRQWEELVKTQITDRRNDARRIIESLSENNSSFSLTKAEFAAICTKCGLDKEYADYTDVIAALDDNDNAVEAAKNKYAGIDLYAKANSTLRYERDYEIQLLLMKRGELQTKENHLKRSLVRAIVSNDDIRKSVTEAGEFLQRVESIYRDVTLKAQKLRLNISINDPDVRKTLHELLEFSI